MQVIITVENRNGMLFNHRRVSRDQKDTCFGNVFRTKRCDMFCRGPGCYPVFTRDRYDYTLPLEPGLSGRCIF